MKKICSLVLLVLSFPVLAVEYYAPILYSFAQQEKAYCGPATAQSWIYTLLGWSPSQYKLASYSGPLDGWLPFWGTNPQELANMLNAYAGYNAGYNRYFGYSNLPSQSVSSQGLVQEIKNEGRHIALASNTVYSNWTTRNGGHWRLAWAVDVSGSTINYIRLHDPLYLSSWMSQYITHQLQDRVYAWELWGYIWSPIDGVGQYQAVSW
jgi:hypothetical protein